MSCQQPPQGHVERYARALRLSVNIVLSGLKSWEIIDHVVCAHNQALGIREAHHDTLSKIYLHILLTIDSHVYQAWHRARWRNQPRPTLRWTPKLVFLIKTLSSSRPGRHSLGPRDAAVECVDDLQSVLRPTSEVRSPTTPYLN